VAGCLGLPAQHRIRYRTEELKDVLLRVATDPQRLIHRLTPKGWATAFGPRAAA
jgi:hypothetical protein